MAIKQQIRPFLDSLELRRLSREHRTGIDMRKHVAGECTRYNYKMSQLWLDEISYELYQEELKRCNGVFTVGSYERILYAGHSFLVNPEQREGEVSVKKYGPQIIASCRPYNNSEQTGTTELISLSHFRRRGEVRVQFETLAEVTIEDEPYLFNLADLSISGMRLDSRVFDKDFPEGTTVWVTLPKLSDKLGIEFKAVKYTLIRILRKKENSLLLQRAGGSKLLLKALEKFIHFVASQNVEHTDEILTLLALIYERIYTQSLLDIPFVIDSGRISAAFIPADTSSAFKVFAHFKRLDMTPLTYKSRIDFLLSEQGADGGYMVVFRDDEDGALYSAMNIEFSSSDEWQQMLAFASQYPKYKIFKILIAKINPMARDKINLRMKPLLDKSESQTFDLIENLKSVQAVGLLVDVTRRKTPVALDNIPETMPSSNPDGLQAPPEVQPFGQAPRRQEPRYIVSLDLDVLIRKRLFSATSLDISPRGLGIVINARILNMQPEEVVKITYKTLFKNKIFSKDLLQEVPYQVVRTIVKENTTIFLTFKPQTEYKQVPKHLDRVLKKMVGEDGVDLHEEMRLAKSNYLQSLIAENSPVIPFFMKKVEDAFYLDRVAMTNASAEVSQLLTQDGKVDFSLIFTDERISRMVRDIRQTRSHHSSMVIYLFRSKSDQFFSATEEELEQLKSPVTFFHMMTSNPYRVLHLVAGKGYRPNYDEITRYSEKLGNLPTKKLLNLRRNIEKVVISGYMTDITEQGQGK